MAKTTVPGAYIADNAVVSAKIASNAIEASHISGGAVVSVDIGDNSITISKIAANAVSTSEIAANAIGSSEIAANAVDSAEIVSGSIDTAHIADSQVTNAKLANSSVTVNSNSLSLGASLTLDTDDIGEGSSNLYHTTARVNSAFDTRLGTKDTGDLSEGSNLYHTTERVQDITGAQLVTNGSHTGISFSYDDDNDGAIDATVSLSGFNTDALSEGSSNLYFTNARAQGALTAGTGIGISSGTISIGQSVATNASPTFDSLTLTGALNITGDINSYNVTDLDVVDKTITLGVGQTEANSDGSGIVIDGSSASILWSETNDRFEINKKLNISQELSLDASGTNDVHLEIGSGTSSNHYAYVDFIGDSTYTDYGLRIIRNNSGANTSSVIHHRGTGAFVLETLEAGDIKLRTSNTDALTVDSSQNATFAGDVLIGSGGGLKLLPTDSHDTDPWILYQYTDSTLRYNFTGAGEDEIAITPPGSTNGRTLTIDTENQRLGIGTTGPLATLHVQPADSDTLANAIFTRQNNAAGSDGNTFSLRNDAANNFVEMNSGGTNNGGYKFYTGTFSGTPAMTIVGAGSNASNVGIGVTNPGYKLAVSSKLVVGDAPAVGLSGNTIHVREGSSSGIHFPLVIGGGTHTAGAAFGLAFDPEGYGNRNKIAILAEGIGAGYSRGRLHFALEGTNTTDQVDLSDSKMCILESGNVGIGAQMDAAGHKLHVWGGSTDTVLAVTTNDNYKSELRLMEDKAGTQHGGYIRYDGNGDYLKLGHYNNASDTNAMSIDDSGNVGLGVTNPAGHFEVHGGRMGIVSTDSSWEQLRVCNTSSTGEAGIAIFNGANSTEFLADTQPIFSNAFTLAINPYGCGSDTLAIGHGNLTDSIWHIDGSGNFGYGPNTENPASYYEISKTRPNVNAPSDYELKLTLNTYGYVGSGYKLAMLQWLGGDTASAQDNFYAGIGSTALDGANNSEEGSLDFHVRNGVSSTETLAVQIIGKAGTGIAGGGQHAKSVLFRYQGIAIDRVWNGYPGISVLNSSDAGTTQSEFRFHGTNSSSAAYPGTSGSDFSVGVRSDGGFITGSDRRRKRNITTIDNALSKVKQLTGKRFQTVNRVEEVQEHVSKNGYKLGFIAQEVEDIIPEAVQYHPDEDDGTENWNTAYSMDYGSVVALLVNAIKEQDVVIQDLKTRIEELEE